MSFDEVSIKALKQDDEKPIDKATCSKEKQQQIPEPEKYEDFSNKKN
jgi:hypothetical protein